MLSKLVGKGVAMGAEYREHRKGVKLSRESSQQNVEQVSAGPSTSPHLSRNVSTSGPEDAPPAYTDAVSQSGGRSLAFGRPTSDDKKAALSQYDDDESDSDDDDLSTEDDTADWELDEAMDRKDSPDDAPPDYRPVDELVRDVLATNHLPANFDRTHLPCPVILPQRRPRKKERGFVRAYAPMLGECSGIDQVTFLSFLENFHKSSQASPVWSVIQVSAAIAGLAPSVIAMAVTTAVQFAAGTAKELQARSRTNDFLDRMNEELFKPAGLFAMIVKYQTAEEVAKSGNGLFARLGVGAQQVDFNTGKAIAKYDRSLSDEKGMADRLKNIRLASGTTRGAIELPEAAPLVFPDVDRAVATDGPETFKDKAKDAKAFMADYLDRRAQMEYAQQDRGSSLAVPEDQRTMKSQYADPNHPMHNGGLVGLVSGGKLGRGSRSGSYNSTQRGYDTSPGPAQQYGRSSMYDSSRLYSSPDMSYRDERRYGKRERRALKTEQRLVEGRRVGRKRERRYESFMYEQEGRFGRDEGRGFGRRGGRRGGGGPIGMLIGAASSAYESSRQPQGQGMTSNAPAQHAPYGESRQPPAQEYDPRTSYGRTPSDSAGYYGDRRPSAAYAVRQRRPRRQKGGPLSMVKRIMQEDVLYLMIVNMPSDAELAEAREAIAQAKNRSD